MDRAEAELALEDCQAHMDWLDGETMAELGGHFTAEQLEAIAWLLRHNQPIEVYRSEV